MLVHRQISDLEALFFQSLGGVEDGMVLNGGGDEMLFAPGLLGMHPAAEGHVVRFAAAAGKINLGGVGVHQAGHLHPGILHGVMAGVTQRIQGAGVAVFRGEEGHHFFQNAGVDGGGRRVVSVYKTVFHKGFISFQPDKRPGR